MTEQDHRLNQVIKSFDLLTDMLIRATYAMTSMEARIRELEASAGVPDVELLYDDDDTLCDFTNKLMDLKYQV